MSDQQCFGVMPQRAIASVACAPERSPKTANECEKGQTSKYADLNDELQVDVVQRPGLGASSGYEAIVVRSEAVWIVSCSYSKEWRGLEQVNTNLLIA